MQNHIVSNNYCCIAANIYIYIYNIHIQYTYTYTNICKNIIKHNIRTSMNERTNERTHFFIKIYLTHFILERVDVGCAWEVSWRREQTATYWPKVLLTIAAFLSHLGWVAQPWVTEGPKPSVCKLILKLASCPQLTPTATGTDPGRLWYLVI